MYCAPGSPGSSGKTHSMLWFAVALPTRAHSRTIAQPVRARCCCMVLGTWYFHHVSAFFHSIFNSQPDIVTMFATGHLLCTCAPSSCNCSSVASVPWTVAVPTIVSSLAGTAGSSSNGRLIAPRSSRA